MKGISLTKGSTLNIDEADLIKEAVQWLITENKRLVIEDKKLTKGLNDIKSQLFDVNRCDTILTSAIDQLLKN